MTREFDPETIEIVRDPERVAAETLQYPLALMRGYMPEYPKPWLELVEMYGKQWNAELDLEPVSQVFGLRLGSPPPADELAKEDYSPLGVMLTMRTFRRTIDATHQLNRDFVAALTTKVEYRAIVEFAARIVRVKQEIEKAVEALSDEGWKLDKDGVLKSIPGSMGGEPRHYMRACITHLWLYLQETCEKVSGHKVWNSSLLREQIHLVLSPFFPESEIRTDSRGPIASAINYTIEHELDSAGQ